MENCRYAGYGHGRNVLFDSGHDRIRRSCPEVRDKEASPVSLCVVRCGLDCDSLRRGGQCIGILHCGKGRWPGTGNLAFPRHEQRLSAFPLLRLCVCGGGSDYADRPDPLREDPPETDSGAVYSRRSDGDPIRRFRASACVALCLRAVNLLHEWWADCLVCISSASSRYGYGGLHRTGRKFSW